jgi:hypothetical protein
MCAITASSSLPARADDYQELGAIGRWRLTKAVDSADISSLDDREARRLVGRVFTITKDNVKFGNRNCGAPELTATIVEPHWYLREQFRSTLTQLHLPDAVTVVNLGCTVAFIKDPNHMMMHWQGWFFDAKRVG